MRGHLALEDDGHQHGGTLIALTLGQINSRTMFGAVRLTDAEIGRVVTSGVAAFVRAYRPA